MPLGAGPLEDDGWLEDEDELLEAGGVKGVDCAPLLKVLAGDEVLTGEDALVDEDGAEGLS